MARDSILSGLIFTVTGFDHLLDSAIEAVNVAIILTFLCALQKLSMLIIGQIHGASPMSRLQ